MQKYFEMFWLSSLEILRVLKPKALSYLNVTSRGGWHRHPVDCWRFYPESGHVLSNRGYINGYGNLMLECFAQTRVGCGYFVAVFLKFANCIDLIKKRVLDTEFDYINDHMSSHPGKVLKPGITNNYEPILALQLLRGLMPKPLKLIDRRLYDTIC